MIELLNRSGRLPRGVRAGRIKSAAEKTAKFGGAPGKYACVMLVKDEGIRRLNRKYFGRNRATDVIAFPMEDEYLLGDVAVSVDTAKRQCRAYGNTVERELMTLAVHGMLHLLGYDDSTAKRRAEMDKTAEKMLESLRKGGGRWKKRKSAK